MITYVIIHYEYLNEPNTVMFHIRLMSLWPQIDHANQTPPKRLIKSKTIRFILQSYKKDIKFVLTVRSFSSTVF